MQRKVYVIYRSVLKNNKTNTHESANQPQKQKVTNTIAATLRSSPLHPSALESLHLFFFLKIGIVIPKALNPRFLICML